MGPLIIMIAEEVALVSLLTSTVPFVLLDAIGVTEHVFDMCGGILGSLPACIALLLLPNSCVCALVQMLSRLVPG
jgi:hypothetical protein